MTGEQGKALGALHMQKNPWAPISCQTLVATRFFPFKTHIALDSDISDMAVYTGANALQSSHGNVKSYLLFLTMNNKR